MWSRVWFVIFALALAACSVDRDGDGYSVRAGDCNDGNPAIHPGAAELCDDVDNDCDGEVNEGIRYQLWYHDADGDGYGTDGAGETRHACSQPPGFAEKFGDGDDKNPSVPQQFLPSQWRPGNPPPPRVSHDEGQ